MLHHHILLGGFFILKRKEKKKSPTPLQASHVETHVQPRPRHVLLQPMGFAIHYYYMFSTFHMRWPRASKCMHARVTGVGRLFLARKCVFSLKLRINLGWGALVRRGRYMFTTELHCVLFGAMYKLSSNCLCKVSPGLKDRDSLLSTSKIYKSPYMLQLNAHLVLASCNVHVKCFIVTLTGITL